MHMEAVSDNKGGSREAGTVEFDGVEGEREYRKVFVVTLRRSGRLLFVPVSWGITNIKHHLY